MFFSYAYCDGSVLSASLCPVEVISSNYHKQIKQISASVGEKTTICDGVCVREKDEDRPR